MPLSPQQAQVLAEQLLDDEEVAGQPSAESAPTGDAENQGLPQRIGSYRIIGVIATGGMGVVYKAEQEHPRRVVALKVLKRGLASPSALRRFEYEAQVLARLRHDGIAHIYDAGTHDDPDAPGEPVPYFAMEFVPNACSIVQFANDRELSLRERLELFADACDAVHHGHQKGIIHRDLTPANILVEGTEAQTYKAATGGRGLSERNAMSVSGGGRGLVKIIDFGIARATDADIAITTLQTDVRELIGTLQYMSPEQCAGDPHDLDIRTDIYSLGVVLYELLCGQLPYDLHDTALPHATRMIQECDPPRPSTISKTLKGDIEAILLKALEKDREKRYQSAMDLCRDVRRYLQGEPIEARAPSRWSLTMRWVARHPVVTTTAACLMIALLTVGATSLSVWFYNFRPHHMVLTPDGREARLMSLGGSIIDTWRTEAENGIRFAELRERPPELGGGRVALIGFSSAYENPYPGQLCAFDVSNDCDHPIWTARITDDDLLPEHIEHGYKSAGVGVIWCDVQDVFADSDHPGSEVIVCYQHGPGSACAVRIYDLSGELLYQIWHDGALARSYWMTGPGRLVLQGTNSEAPWSDRGYDNVQGFPLVVLAVDPKIGHIAQASTTTTPGGDTETLAWYKCLWPPTSFDVLSSAPLTAPYAGEDPARFVKFNVALTANPRARLSWLLDQAGTAVPGTRATTDGWKLDTTAPDPEIFSLADLPPIVSRKE